MSTNPSPSVVRSQRNNVRRPTSNHEIELDAYQDDESRMLRPDQAKTGRPDNLDLGSHGKLKLVRPRDHLGYFSTSALILNKMVGTGVFVAPPTVLAITGSKGISLVLWLLGGVVSWAGLAVYLEYGIRFPLSGGELHYIDFVWTKPKLLMTYTYSIFYIILSGSQANSLVFGQSVLLASTVEGTVLDPRLQKLFAILLIAAVCLLQAFSRINYVRFANAFAVYKITFLSIVSILGLCALRNERTPVAAVLDDPYGVKNLSDAFAGTTLKLYPVSIAMLDIFRVYSGYENANFILEEVRRPPGDETRVFRRGAKFTILIVWFFYIMVNVSLFAACSTEELINSSDVLSLFFSKVFGPSPKTRTASGTLLAISAAGNIMSATYSAVRVKQEIARLGILPFPAYFAKSTRYDTPGPALLLHFIFSTVFIIATPLSNANGYLVFSTIFYYDRTIVAMVLGIALLAAPHLKSFEYEGQKWSPKGSSLGLWYLFPLTGIYIVANLFVFVVDWFPASLQNTLHTKERVVASWVGPTVGTACFAAGAAYWLWDRHILHFLGYDSEPLQERTEGLTVHITFERRLSGFAACVVKGAMLYLDKLKEFWDLVICRRHRDQDEM